MLPWPRLPQHLTWLQSETQRLLGFGIRAIVPGKGAAWLDGSGLPDESHPVETWITCRTAHVYSLGVLLGRPGSRVLAQGAVDALVLGPLRDATHGGWFHDARQQGTKEAYDHAFVVLASSSATLAGLDGARQLLDDALDTIMERFWDEEHGLMVDAVSPSFDSVDPYRGINANMHSVEAFLAAADVTGDVAWLRRAERIARFARSQAEANQWRLPEHFDEDWAPQLEYNVDRPDDPFRPYGATVGHGLEWARLFLHLQAALGDTEAGWVDAAVSLYDRAVADGWAADGKEGFVYTTGWDGTPVTRDRMHWVAAEAIGAAAALYSATGDERFASDYARWWDHAETCFIDRVDGSWFHQLDPQNRPTDTVWPGKPDLYHAVQATLIPRLPLTPSLATAVSRGLLQG